MRAYLILFAVGRGVGLLYAALPVKSPAAALVALLGARGMVMGEGGDRSGKAMASLAAEGK